MANKKNNRGKYDEEEIEKTSSRNYGKQGRRRSNRRGRPGKSDSASDNASSYRRTSGDNDVAWYTVSSELVQDTASLPYSNPVGREAYLPYKMRSALSQSGTTYHFQNGTVKLPGVARVGISLIPGEIGSAQSPVNVAANSIYSFVRHANSGHSNYDPTNLMEYLIAADHIYAMLAHLMRAYGSIGLYSQLNAYYPDMVLKTMGFDPNDLRSNYASFRGYINMCVARINSIAIPNAFNLFKRHFFMYNNIYKDSSNDKAQLYIYVPDNYAVYDETLHAGTGTIVYKPLPIATLLDTDPTVDSVDALGVMTVSQWETIMNEMIDNFLGSEDIGIISGDILKAYGTDLLTMTPIQETYTIMPVYSQEVLEQLHNATITGPAVYVDNFNTQTASSFYIYENPNIGIPGLYARWRTKPSSLSAVDMSIAGFNEFWWAAHDADLISTRLDSPDANSTMVDTRLKAMGTTRPLGTDDVADWTIVGTELVHTVTYIKFTDSTTHPGIVPFRCMARFETNMITIPYTVDSGGNYVSEIGQWYGVAIGMLTQFDWYPMMWIVNYVVDSANNRVDIANIRPFFNIDNYALLDNSVLNNIHTVATLSLYNIPVSGNWLRK